MLKKLAVFLNPVMVHLQKSISWWTSYHTWLYEFFLLMVAVLWCMAITFSRAAATGQAVVAMVQIAPLATWSFVTGAWAILYISSILLHSPKWRAYLLVLVTGFWALVSGMFWFAFGFTTGVGVYSGMTLGSIIAAAYAIERAANKE